eukprot:366197-Chlamydomonas_euryale.AAC.6
MHHKSARSWAHIQEQLDAGRIRTIHPQDRMETSKVLPDAVHLVLHDQSNSSTIFAHHDAWSGVSCVHTWCNTCTPEQNYNQARRSAPHSCGSSGAMHMPYVRMCGNVCNSSSLLADSLDDGWRSHLLKLSLIGIVMRLQLGTFILADRASPGQVGPSTGPRQERRLQQTARASQQGVEPHTSQLLRNLALSLCICCSCASISWSSSGELMVFMPLPMRPSCIARGMPPPVPTMPPSTPMSPRPPTAPSMPAPVPSMPAPAPSMPAPVPSMPAPVPSMPAPVPSMPAPAPSMPAPVPHALGSAPAREPGNGSAPPRSPAPQAMLVPRLGSAPNSSPGVPPTPGVSSVTLSIPAPGRGKLESLARALGGAQLLGPFMMTAPWADFAFRRPAPTGTLRKAPPAVQ